MYNAVAGACAHPPSGDVISQSSQKRRGLTEIHVKSSLKWQKPLTGSLSRFITNHFS
jgi:hypothetical protein